MERAKRQSDYDSQLGNAGKHALPRGVRPAHRALRTLALALIIACAWPARLKSAVTLSLTTGAGGVTISGTRPNYVAGFGNVNGLGVGTPGAGVTVITTGVAGGVLYTTPYNIVISGMNATHYATVSAYVSTNFAKPALLILQSCYPSSGCSSAASFTTISLSAATPTPIIISPGIKNSTVTASLGLFVANSNGAGVAAGAETATLTFIATDLNNGATSTVRLNLNSPSENLQTAVQLLLATAPGGLTISPASDFSMNYGNVNGLGIGPGAGLTVVASAGGVIYSTPYLIQPSFSTFTSTTGSLKVYVSTDFAHPAILNLEDAAVSAGPYVAISKIVGAQTSITTTAGSGSSLTRYLGLFVSNANGAGAFTGADSGTLTYTLTVP